MEPSSYQLKGSQQQGTLVHFSLFREKREKHKFWQFSKYVDFSCKYEQDMFENSEFRRFFSFYCFKIEKLDFSDFVYATRDLTHNFIKLTKCIKNVYDSPSILKYYMIVCGKLISYEYNSENLDTTVDIRKFHK